MLSKKYSVSENFERIEDSSVTTIMITLPTDRLVSFRHKVDRINNQEAFAKQHLDKFSMLTKREYEVLALLGAGCTNLQISNALFISRMTVEQHRKNMYKKLNVGSINELLSYILAFNVI